jgi:hypothetical protein
VHLLSRLAQEVRTRPLVVPSMGNTVLGIAVGARAFGCPVTGVLPQTIGRGKDEKLQALGVELVKIAGGGGLPRRAMEVAHERGAYFVHPHLDPLWTDGYPIIVEEVLRELPDCRAVIFPVGGGLLRVRGGTSGREKVAGLLTRCLHGFFTKLFHKRVNARRERAIRFRVSFGPRAGLELFSMPATKSP